MTITVCVCYPNEPDSKFDMNYYLNTHMPLVQEKWGPHGMISARAIKGLAAGDPKSELAYQVMAILEFRDMDAFKAAGKAAGAEVMADLANFTDVAPYVQISENL